MTKADKFLYKHSEPHMYIELDLIYPLQLQVKYFFVTYPYY